MAVGIVVSGLLARADRSAADFLSPDMPPPVAVHTLELDVNLLTGDVMLNSGGLSFKNIAITSSGSQLMPGTQTGPVSFTIWNTISASNPNLGGQILASSPKNLTEAFALTTPFFMAGGQEFDYGSIFPAFGNQDLTFQYTLAGALKAVTGTVVYLNQITQTPTSDSWQATIGSGNWSNPGNWTAGVPTNATNVFIAHADAIDRVVTYDNTATNTFGNLRLDNTGPGTDSLNLSANLLHVSQTEYVGDSGKGTFNQSGGTNIAGTLYLGNGTTATGIYNLSGGTLNASNVYAGFLGSGTFNQTNGTASLGALSIGGGVGGAVHLSGGTLNATSISVYAAGLFDQTGGSLNASFYQSGGTVTGTLQNQTIFTYASGLFAGQLLNQGSVVLNADFTAANGINNISATPLTIPAARSVTLKGPGLLNDGAVILAGNLTSSQELLGNTTAGALTQNGGINTVTGQDIVGYHGNGTYLQNGGVHTANSLIVGGYSNGTYTLNNGSLNVATEIDLAANMGSWGALNSGGGQLVSQGSLFIGGGQSGSGGIGILSVSNNATVSVAGTLQLYGTSSGSNVSRIIQSGGTITANTGVILDGPYNQIGGVLKTAGSLIVGNSGSGSCAQNGGSAFVGSLALGNLQGTTGTYILSAGTLQNSGDASVGNAPTAVGAFNQSGGLHDMQNLYIASAGASGTYTLSGAGVLQAHQQIIVGNGGQGAFNLIGGTMTASGGLLNHGHFNMTGGTFNGNLTNAVGGAVVIGSATNTSIVPIDLNGDVTNYGDLQIKNASLTVGTFNEYGAFHTGPATVSAVNFNLEPGAVVSAGAGDQFNISGNFSDASTSTASIISGATLRLAGAGPHTVTVGSTLAAQNWGVVDIDGVVRIVDANNQPATIYASDIVYEGTTSAKLAIGFIQLTSPTTYFDGAQSVSVNTTNPAGTTAFWSDTGNPTLDGDFVFSNGAAYINNGRFYVQNDRSFTGGGEFDNYGIFRKQGGGGVSAFFVPFNNYGTVDLKNSTLQLNSNGSHTGSFTVANGATLDFHGGVHTFNGATLGGAGGSVLVSGATLNANPDLTLAPTVADNVNVTFSGGMLNVAGSEYVGYAGTNAFHQTGGSNTAAVLKLGALASGVGSYKLDGGVLAVSGNEWIGHFGAGVFMQSGGNNTAANLLLGNQPSGVGTYNLSGGQATVSSNIYVGGSSNGAGGLGRLNISGGALNVANAITVFNTSSGTTSSGIGLSGGNVGAAILILPDWSRLNFTGGTLNLGGVSSNSGTLTIGNNGGSATVNQFAAGSAVGVGNSVALGASVGSAGTYNLGGGQLNVGSTIYIGGSSAGPGGTGQLNMSGGTLNAAVLNNYGSYIQTGGIATFTTAVNGGGSFSIGGGAGTALANLPNLPQGSLIIKTGGNVVVRPSGVVIPLDISGTLDIAAGSTYTLAPYPSNYTNTVRVVDSINNLVASAPGNLMKGRIDLNDHSLLIGNVNGVPATAQGVHALVAQGYNTSPTQDPITHTNANSAGFNYSNGTAGIVSTVVNNDAASTNHNTVFGGVGSPKYLAIAVADSGDNAYINWQSGPVGDGTIPAGKTLVAMTIMGDVNMDGVVDTNDFNIWQAAYTYQGANDPNFSHRPDHWAMGDMTGDGIVDINDFNYLQVAWYGQIKTPLPPSRKASFSLAQSRNNVSVAPTTTLTGRKVAASADSHASLPPPGPYDTLELYTVYNGHVILHNGTNSNISIKNVVIASQNSQLTPGLQTSWAGFTIWNTISYWNPQLDGMILSASTANITEAFAPDKPFVMTPGESFDYGAILPNYGYYASGDLTFLYTQAGELKATTGYVGGFGGLPEPSALSLIALGAMGLMARRRKRVANVAADRPVLPGL